MEGNQRIGLFTRNLSLFFLSFPILSFSSYPSLSLPPPPLFISLFFLLSPLSSLSPGHTSLFFLPSQAQTCVNTQNTARRKRFISAPRI